MGKNIITLSFEDDDGNEIELEFPAVWSICSHCQGEGNVVNPSIGAITQSEWEHDWDPEERENYFNGVYDVSCDECEGTGKVKCVDYENLTPVQKKDYDEWEKYDIACQRARAEDRATMRAECGYWD